jgi:hypothetical protein
MSDQTRLAGYARQLSPQARAILTGAAERRDAVTVAALQRGGLLDEATNELTADGRTVVALLASEPSEDEAVTSGE